MDIIRSGHLTKLSFSKAVFCYGASNTRLQLQDFAQPLSVRTGCLYPLTEGLSQRKEGCDSFLVRMLQELAYYMSQIELGTLKFIPLQWEMTFLFSHLQIAPSTFLYDPNDYLKHVFTFSGEACKERTLSALLSSNMCSKHLVAWYSPHFSEDANSFALIYQTHVLKRLCGDCKRKLPFRSRQNV